MSDIIPPGNGLHAFLFRRNPGLLLVAAVAAAVYAPTLGYDLVWDDSLLIGVMEGRIRSGGVGELLASDFRLYPWEATGYYRPVAMVSLWFDRLLSGSIPFSFHLTNVLLHAAVSALVASAGRLLTGSALAGLLSGLLFAVHPSHVESVAFVSGRTDLFAALFGMLSLWCWLRDRSGVPSRWLPWAAWGGLSYLLSCLSKEVGVLLPAVLLSWDAVAPAGEGDAARPGWWRRNRWWFASWGLSLAALVALRWGVAGLPPVPGSSYAGSHVEEALRDWTLVPSMWLEYLRMLVVPWPLKIVYAPYHLGLTVVSAAALAGFAALAWATSGAGSRRVGLWGLLWVIAFLLPVSGVVPLHGAIVAERFLYLPSAGFCVMAGMAAARLPDLVRLPRPALAGAVVGMVALLSAGVLSASRHWKDEVTLFSRVIRTTTGERMAHLNLGNALAERGRLEEAITQYVEVLRIKPDYAEAHYNLGNALAARGRTEEATARFREAIRIKPSFPQAHVNLGILLAGLGLEDEAMAHYREGLRLRPDDPRGHVNLGNELARRGRFDEAAFHFREALRADPGDAVTLNNIGTVLSSSGRVDEGIAYFRQAIRIRPDYAGARHNLGIALKSTGQAAEAEAHLAEARRLGGAGRGVIPGAVSP